MVLASRSVQVVLVALLMLGFVTGESGAREGLVDKQTWVGPDGQAYTVAMLYEDGLFGPKPGRPVVLDAEGRFVAFGPLTYDAIVRCAGQRDCHVLLIDGTLIRAIPSPAGFRPPSGPRNSIIADNFAEHGFSRAAARPVDYWRMLVAPLFNATLTALLSLAFFSALGVLCGGATGLRSHIAARFPPYSFVRIALTLVWLCVWAGSLYVMLIPMIFMRMSAFTILPLTLCFAGAAFGAWRLLAARRSMPA